MAEKKPQIVIKKITVVNGGGHGGAWKVAFADFMTAMMAFFLVMWLMATASEPQKKAISDYFSTPSVIEYQFSNLGVQLTLEKLFLDLINEPLKTLTGMMDPMDRTPNVMGMGMKKVVMSYMADQLGALATNLEVSSDTLVFDLPDTALFEKGTANPTPQFVDVMEKVKGVTTGLEDSDVEIVSVVYTQSIPDGDRKRAKNVAEERLSMVQSKVEGSLEHDSVTVKGRSVGKKDDRGGRENKSSTGFIRIEIKQKETLPDGRKPRPIEDNIFGKSDGEKNVYDNFVNQLSQAKRKPSSDNNKRRH